MFMHLLCILFIKIFTKPSPREHRPCPWVRLGAVGCPYTPCTCLHHYAIILIIIYLLCITTLYTTKLCSSFSLCLLLCLCLCACLLLLCLCVVAVCASYCVLCCFVLSFIINNDYLLLLLLLCLCVLLLLLYLLLCLSLLLLSLWLLLFLCVAVLWLSVVGACYSFLILSIS